MLRYMPHPGQSRTSDDTSPCGAPDVVYLLGPDHDRDRVELRFSLRSLRNIPHGAVWIAGAPPPDWAVDVEHIAVEAHPNRYTSSTLNLLAACEHPKVSSSFLLFNDDFYVMSPTPSIPLMHRGYCEDLMRQLSWAEPRYMQGMRRARDLCRRFGVENPLSYEVHAPMPVEKEKMLAVLTCQDFVTDRASARGGLDAHKRTLYGNLAAGDQETAQILDPKVQARRGGFDPASPFLSTSRWFPNSDIARHIATVFAEPCPYEAEYDGLSQHA